MALPGWTKYKEIIIAGFAGDQIELNYMLTITYETSMKSDFSDIRFVDSDNETLLDQFRESYTSETTSVWWIQVDVPAAGKTIYMYYGNASASLKSVGADTFPFFDDFTGDLSKWEGDTAQASIVDNELRFEHTNGYIRGTTTFGKHYGIIFKGKCSSYATCKAIGFQLENGMSAGFSANYRQWYSNTDATFRTYNNGAESTNVTKFSTSFQILEIRRISDNLAKFWLDGSLEATHTLYCDNANSYAIAIGHYTTGSASITICDYIFVFKLPQDGTEPATLEPGEEKSVGSLKLKGNEGVILYGTTFNITGASHVAGTVTVTATGHTFLAKDRILIEDVIGMTDLNAHHSIVAVATNTFDVALTTEQSYTSGGTARRLVEVRGWIINIDTVLIEVTDSGDDGWKKYLSKYENWYGIFRGLLRTSTLYPALMTEVSLKLIADSSNNWEGQALLDFENERVPIFEEDAVLFEFGFKGTSTLTPT